MGDFFDTAMNMFGYGSPQPQASEQPTAAPVAAPISNEPKPLPLQPTPASEPMKPSQEVNFQQPSIVPLQKTESTTSVAPTDKAALESSANRQSTAYQNEINYVKNLNELNKKASSEADQYLGLQQEKAQQYADTVNANREKLQNDLREMDSQVEKLKATQFKDFWADKSTAGKIGMAIAVGLGQYAATMTGTQNMAWNILQKAMDDDFRLQQANYDKQLKNIDALRVGMEQKQKLMDAATKDFEVYKVARAGYIEDSLNKQLQEQGKLTPALQEMLTKTQIAKEAAYQQAMSGIVDKYTNQTLSAIPQTPIDHKQAIADVSNEKTPIGQYNKAIQDYNQMKDFKKSGNYNASVIKLVADGLKQGSYDPSKFDPTTRSLVQRLKDQGEKALGEGEQQEVVKSAEKYFTETAKSAYKNVQSQLPVYWKASLQTSSQMGQKPIRDMYIPEAPQEILNQSADLSKTGMTKASK
jgi:hypothetical protein